MQGGILVAVSCTPVRVAGVRFSAGAAESAGRGSGILGRIPAASWLGCHTITLLPSTKMARQCSQQPASLNLEELCVRAANFPYAYLTPRLRYHHS